MRVDVPEDGRPVGGPAPAVVVGDRRQRLQAVGEAFCERLDARARGRPRPGRMARFPCTPSSITFPAGCRKASVARHVLVRTTIVSWIDRRLGSAIAHGDDGAVGRGKNRRKPVSRARAPGLGLAPWPADPGHTGMNDPAARRHAAARPAARALPRRPRARAPPGLRRPAAAVQRRLPGRREHPGLARAREGRPARAGVARSSSRTTRSRRSTGASATTRARASATAPSSTARSRSTRSSASSATWRSSRAGRSTPPPVRSGKRVLVDRRRAERAVGRLPPGPARPRGRDPRRRRRARRDDALRHPGLPAAARRPRRRGRPDRGAGRAHDLRPPGRGPRRRAATRAASTRSSSRSARTSPSASTSPRATPAGSSTRCRSCAASPPASGR